LQLEQVRPRQFIWAQRHLGIGRWDVTLRRILTSDSDVADSLLTFLRRCAVLSEAREETRQAFAQIATERTVDAGTSIVEQDAQWPYLGLVRAGSLGAIIGSTTGREQRLFDVLTCDTFGDIETLDGGRTLARIIATTATRVVTRAARHRRLRNNERFRIRTRACGDMRTTSTCPCRRAFRTSGAAAIVRVAAAILPYAPPEAGLSPSLEALRRMTQAQIAATAGTAKEVAARAVAELEAVGAIQRIKGHIALVNRQNFKALWTTRNTPFIRTDAPCHTVPEGMSGRRCSRFFSARYRGRIQR
jgi:CRP-like cAMP-binding protein